MKAMLCVATLALAIVACATQSDWEAHKANCNLVYPNATAEAAAKAQYAKSKKEAEYSKHLYATGQSSSHNDIHCGSSLSKEERKKHLNNNLVPKTPAQVVGKAKRASSTSGMSAAVYAYSSTSPKFSMSSCVSGLTLPTVVDWSASGWAEPVRNQGQCGSCWTFSTSSAMSYHVYNTTKAQVTLSPQELVDCAGIYGGQGCNGGSPAQAMEYIQTQNQVPDASYPYTGVTASKCNSTALSKATANYTIPQFYQVTSGDSCALKQAVALYGPVVISIQADYIMDYSSGIYNGTDPSTGQTCSSSSSNVDHAVLLVGYNATEGSWKIKNSWGPSWGEKGYIRMSMTAMSSNICGILSYNYGIL